MWKRGLFVCLFVCLFVGETGIQKTKKKAVSNRPRHPTQKRITHKVQSRGKVIACNGPFANTSARFRV